MRKIKPGELRKNSQITLDALRAAGIPLTAREVAAQCGLDERLTRHRLKHLATRGHVHQATARLCSISHRRAMTWRVV